MEVTIMRGYPSRSEKHGEMIEKFMASDSESLTLRLYSREVMSLQKAYHGIVITKKESTKGTFIPARLQSRRNDVSSPK